MQTPSDPEVRRARSLVASLARSKDEPRKAAAQRALDLAKAAVFTREANRLYAKVHEQDGA